MAGQPERRRVTSSGSGDIATELSARRTGMSFQRTRMSADRTLMSVIRTSLSLISFGFTIYQFLTKATAEQATRGTVRFAVVLVALGVVMLVFGIMHQLLKHASDASSPFGHVPPRESLSE